MDWEDDVYLFHTHVVIWYIVNIRIICVLCLITFHTFMIHIQIHFKCTHSTSYICEYVEQLMTLCVFAFGLHVNYRLIFLWLWMPCAWFFQSGQNKGCSMSGVDRFPSYDLTFCGIALCYSTNSSSSNSLPLHGCHMALVDTPCFGFVFLV